MNRRGRCHHGGRATGTPLRTATHGDIIVGAAINVDDAIVVGEPPARPYARPYMAISLAGDANSAGGYANSSRCGHQ